VSRLGSGHKEKSHRPTATSQWKATRKNDSRRLGETRWPGPSEKLSRHFSPPLG